MQADGTDLVLGAPLKFGIGYGLPQPDTLPYLPTDGRLCFWGGWGGSFILIDIDRRMTLAYMMNQMAPGDHRRADGRGVDHDGVRRHLIVHSRFVWAMNRAATSASPTTSQVDSG